MAETLGSVHDGPVARGAGEAPSYDKIIPMTKRLNDAIAQIRSLPETEQDRAAEVLFSFVHGPYEEELGVREIMTSVSPPLRGANCCNTAGA